MIKADILKSLSKHMLDLKSEHGDLLDESFFRNQSVIDCTGCDFFNTEGCSVSDLSNRDFDDVLEFIYFTPERWGLIILIRSFWEIIKSPQTPRSERIANTLVYYYMSNRSGCLAAWRHVGAVVG